MEDENLRDTLFKCQERLDFLEFQSKRIKLIFGLGIVLVLGIVLLNNHNKGHSQF